MPVHDWKFILTQANGVNLGEVLGPRDFEFYNPLSRLPTAKFTLRLDHPQIINLTADVAGNRGPGLTRLKAYRDGVLRFHGPLITNELVADNNAQTVTANFAGAAWYFTKRLVGVGSSGGGYKEGLQVGSAASLVDRITIAQFLLGVVNTVEFCGVGDGSAGHAASTTTAFGPVYHMPLSDAIAQLAASDVGFDWQVTPVEPTTVSGRIQIGLFDARPVIGGVTTNLMFEYGTGRGNIVGFNRQSSVEGILNQGFIQYPGFPDTSQSVKKQTAVTSQGTYGTMEGLVDGGEVAWDQLRQELVNAHVLIRRNPRTMLTATFARDTTPTPYTDFANGDYIRLRGGYGTGANAVSLFDDVVRVWGMTFKLDNSGAETVELELAAS